MKPINDVCTLEAITSRYKAGYMDTVAVPVQHERRLMYSRTPFFLCACERQATYPGTRPRDYRYRTTSKAQLSYLATITMLR